MPSVQANEVVANFYQSGSGQEPLVNDCRGSIVRLLTVDFGECAGLRH